jgi:hypothetical protein
MKKSLIALIAVVAAVALVVGQAVAANGAAAPTKVTVAMHDPGCHWFLVGGKYVKALVVKGPVSLANFDEAALKIAGPTGVKLDAVGKNVALAHGKYRITMVGQAPDDNTLWLIVK